MALSAIDHKKRRIIIAFRGSTDFNNWLENLDFWQMAYPSSSCGEACKVHRGFYGAFDSLAVNLTSDVLWLSRKYPRYSYFITGHSLGGAIAVLCAAHIASNPVFSQGQRKPAVTLYTFGEPRVGNSAFSNWTASLLGKQHRITHGRDPVPRLPPQSWGYLHLPREWWYAEENATSDTPYRVCEDSTEAEDPLCSLSVYSTTVSDHLLYLGICTRCNCSSVTMNDIYALDNNQTLLNIIHERTMGIPG
ncbi:triacylglycerol lipase [Angomonas deanei]|uniref:Lipase (Class 3), putative n=1 Tax=Angomonas deanei TaxID=59799 RepID=S9WVZ8_9TRYP|nr:triacylglycerol lipase [Angomonas deanei]EPY41389.1 triacylglycerol lipase [Angomonas deanei]CAD2213538.1 Lipase (class 3), putative [Angomonas deanei]|eukprot:EPY40150.1 triacylglycerol lipase [Angomonas deanei]